MTAQAESDGGAIFLCVRVPKSGSVSLTRGLEEAFAARRIFHLPDTLDPDSRVSPIYRLRFLRSQRHNLKLHYRRTGIDAAFACIRSDAAPGDLVTGGHIDFRSASHGIGRPLKIITLLREPATRARSEYDYMRRGILKRPYLCRIDASVLHKAAGRYDFDSYLDYLFAHRAIYGDIACQYLGWDGSEDIADFFACNVFHCDVLEESERFARGLSEKLDRPFALPHENRLASDRATLTLAQRAKLEQIYPRDVALHRWVSVNL